LARRFDEAVPKLLLAMQEDPGYPAPYRFLAACYAHTGRLDDAREIVERLRGITSVVIPDASYLQNPQHPSSCWPVCTWRPAMWSETFSLAGRP
jgi:hypothetical protein